MTTNKLTVRACRERTQEILELHKQIKNGYRGMSLEHVQGLIDDLREDVIQTIANGSKCPYALTRLITNLPRVEYTTQTTATLGTDLNEPLCYPLGMSPSELRNTFDSLGNSFDALRVQYGKLSHTITHLYSEWNSSSSSQSESTK